MSRTENIEMLLRLSESLDIKETDFKQRVYNLIILKLKLFDIEEYKPRYDELLARIIIKEVGIYYDLCKNFNEIRSRKRIYSTPRFVAIYIISTNTKLKYETISEMFKYPKHSMVSHAKKTISDLLDSDKKLLNDVTYLAERLNLIY